MVVRNVVVADIGGTNITVERHVEGEPKDQPMVATSRKISRPGSFSVDFSRLSDAIEEVSFGEQIDSISLSVAGKLDDSHSKVIAAGNLGHWVGFNLVKTLLRNSPARVIVRNDTETAGEALATFGPEEVRGVRSRVCVIGTGFGGSTVSWNGDDYTVTAGEPGHQPLLFGTDADPCGCGGSGHIETLLGGDNLARRFGKPTTEFTKVDWLEVAPLVARALQGGQAWDPVQYYFFSGGVACGAEETMPGFFDYVTQLLAENPIYGKPQVKLHPSGKRAGLEGALAVATSGHARQRVLV